MSVVAIIANGVIHDDSMIAPLIRSYPHIVAVDGGLNHCYRLGIRPHQIVGDLDSASAESLSFYQTVEMHRLERDKDETDLEVAVRLWIDRPGIKSVTLFAALENRTDHTLANLYLLARYPGRLMIESETEWLVAVDQRVDLTTLPGQTLSLLPLGKAGGVTTKGLKWELKNQDLQQEFLSVSNVAVGESVQVTVNSGALICCLQKGVL